MNELAEHLNVKQMIMDKYREGNSTNEIAEHVVVTEKKKGYEVDFQEARDIVAATILKEVKRKKWG